MCSLLRWLKFTRVMLSESFYQELEKMEADAKARLEIAQKNKLDAQARKKLEADLKKQADDEEKIRRREEDERKKSLADEKKRLDAEEKKRIDAEAKIKADRLKDEQELRKMEALAALSPVKLSYDQRKNKLQQEIEVTSDSLVLSFYDNGVVDGDSISVYLDGKPVVMNAKLTTTATKKMIGVAGLGEMTLLLVAENLGTLPPNTGLITIRDGENLFQVNFSADLQTNATILIRRKKK